MFTDDQIKQLKQLLFPIEKRLGTLEQGQKSLEQGQKSLEQGQKSLEQGQKELKQAIERIERKLDFEVKDIVTNIAHMSIYLDRRFERIENELGLPPFPQPE